MQAEKSVALGDQTLPRRNSHPGSHAACARHVATLATDCASDRCRTHLQTRGAARRLSSTTGPPVNRAAPGSLHSLRRTARVPVSVRVDCQASSSRIMIRPGHPVVRGGCGSDADEPCDGPHRRCLIVWAGGGIFGLPLVTSVIRVRLGVERFARLASRLSKLWSEGCHSRFHVLSKT